MHTVAGYGKSRATARCQMTWQERDERFFYNPDSAGDTRTPRNT